MLVKSHVILIQAHVKVGSGGKVEQRFVIKSPRAEKTQRRREEVGTLDRTSFITNS